MARNLQELNRRIAEAKVKSKPSPQPQVNVDLNKIVDAIEGSKQPIVNLPDRRPIEYQLEVTKRNNNGAIVSAKITPIFEGS